MAWVYIGIVVVGSTIAALIIDPELIAERSQFKEGIKGWDIVLATLMARVIPLATLIVTGLDVRFGWSTQIPLALQIAALAIMVLGLLWANWAMVSNKFFSAVVRIQRDRGHTVVSSGPYRVVRHPGYAGGIIFNLATPLILNSLWAFIPAVLTVCITVVRTALEDRTLQDELDGYKDYAQRVRYRLLPGVW